jgi:hypothetical protein
MKEIDERNAVAIAETLVHHGQCLKSLEERLSFLQGQIGTVNNLLQQVQQQVHLSLVNKYGHGSTEQV